MASYTKEEKIKRWLRFGVFPSFFPVMLAIAFDFIASNFNIITTFSMLSNHFLDVILVSFAIAVGVYSSASDLERNLDAKQRENYGYEAIAWGFISIAFYSVLYVFREKLPTGAKYIIFAIFLLVARADVELGKRIENDTPENTKARQRAPK
jgi:hypothetical protein